MPDLDPCEIWSGPFNKRSGYAQLRHGANRGRGVHVVALEQRLGRRLLPGMQANHHCDVKLCVNPEHLYEGTQRDNVRDMVQRGRGHEQNVTHCPRGHEYGGDNLYITPAGKRHCRRCTALNQRRYRAQKEASQWASA